MRLVQWVGALRQLERDSIVYGSQCIPLALAMSALLADSRATLFRRMGELREAGYETEIRGEYFAVLGTPSGPTDA